MSKLPSLPRGKLLVALAVSQPLLAGLWYVVAIEWLAMRREGSSLIHIATYTEPGRSAAFMLIAFSLELLVIRNLLRVKRGQIKPRQALIAGIASAVAALLAAPLLSTAFIAERFGNKDVTVESGAIPWQRVSMRKYDGGYCVRGVSGFGRVLRVEGIFMWVPWLPFPRTQEAQTVLEIVRCRP